MNTKKSKYGIGIIRVLIFIIIISSIIFIAKNISSNKSLTLTNGLLYQARDSMSEIQSSSSKEQSLDSEKKEDSYTFNTAGDDMANYVDGDTSGSKSKWIKNGDIWTYTFYVDDPNDQWYIWEDSSSLMDDFTGNYTENNAGTLFTEETLNSFTPTENMKITTNSNGKPVYTWFDTENSYKVIENDDSTYTKITTKLSFTVTNYNSDLDNSISYGNLTIKKVVTNIEGNELTKDEDSTNFIFTIKLTANENSKAFIEGTKSYGDVVFKDGVGKVSLKAGESITIPDIPVGISYSVTENEIDGYETSYDSNSGTITKDSNDTVTFTNIKKVIIQPGDEKCTDITIKKVVTGNFEIDDSYNFEISFSNLKANTTYTMSNGMNFTSDANGLANASISLKNNESITIKNIPVGSKYKVYEYAGNYISSYFITDNNNLGLINNNSNNNTKINKELSTFTETADEGEDIVITFTNEKIATQNLKLTKVVTDKNDKNSYIFDIEFSNMKGKSSFNSSVGKITADSNGKANITVYIAGGEEAEFYNVPVGTTYKIKELASSSISSYKLTDENGMNKIIRASAANTQNNTDLSTEVETVNEGEEVTVLFINDTINQEPNSVTASFEITKDVLDTKGKKIGNCEDTFTFELTPDNEKNPMPKNSSITIKGNGEESFGTITFTEAGTYSYKLTEKAGDLKYYSYDDSVYTIVYDVTNIEGLLNITKTVKKNELDSDVITFKNIISMEDVKILKTDEAGNSLSGASLQILDSNGKVVEKWVTGKDKEELKLLPGTYILHEENAPKGYEIADDILFVVNEDGSVYVNDNVVDIVIMVDSKIKSDLNISNDTKEDIINNNSINNVQELAISNNNQEKTTNITNDVIPKSSIKKGPSTGDKIVIYSLIFILSSVILIIVIKKKYHK